MSRRGKRGRSVGVRIVLPALCLGVVLTTGHLLAEAPSAVTPSPQDFVLAGEVMSPYCPGRTLAACPSSAAAELRVEVAARLAGGESREVIVESLVARFGEEIRGAPRPVGFGLLLWVLPPVLGGLLLVAVVVVGWHSRVATSDVVARAPASMRAAFNRQLDDELEDLD